MLTRQRDDVYVTPSHSSGVQQQRSNVPCEWIHVIPVIPPSLNVNQHLEYVTIILTPSRNVWLQQNPSCRNFTNSYRFSYRNNIAQPINGTTGLHSRYLASLMTIVVLQFKYLYYYVSSFYVIYNLLLVITRLNKRLFRLR